MIITINRDTLPNEMHHLAIALQRIAAENGYVAMAEGINIGEMSVKVDIDTTTAIEALAALAKREGVNAEVLPPAVVSVSSHDDNITTLDMTQTPPVVMSGPPDIAVSDLIDSTGLPWDARVHAGSRERNTDGSWRVRRRPKGVEEAEWDATLNRVTAELRDLMEIPVSAGAVLDAATETALTDAEVDEFVDIVQGMTGLQDDAVATITGVTANGAYVQTLGDETVIVTPRGDAAPIVVPPAAIIPPPLAVTPPIVVAPPVAVTASPPIETFAQLMSWLTGRTPKDEAAKPAMVVKVNEILTANGLTTLQQLGQRAELIPQVLAQFKVAFGE